MTAELPGRPVREGDRFDVDAVTAWLHGAVPGLTGAPEVRQFTAGASNLTYLLHFPDRDLILRRPPVGRKAAGAHDMAREYRLQQALAPTFALVPEMVALCEDEAVLGATFYVMARVPGAIPGKRLPPGVDLDRNGVVRLADAFLDTLVRLHATPVEDGSPLAAFGKGRGYTARQVAGWTRRYRDARTWNVPGWGPVIRWLEAHTPADADHVLIHNDFRFDNLVLDPADPTRVVAVLDWELATVGCPLMDLGNSLAYWVEAGDDRLQQAFRKQPTHLPGMPTRRELATAYGDRTGRDTTDLRFQVVMGLFRLAGIAQQIYERYHKGQTRNPAFRHFWLVNHYLRWRAGRAIRGRW